MWLVIQVGKWIVELLTREPTGPRTVYGPQVDAWAAIVSMKGDLEAELQNRVVTKMEDKGLAGCEVAWRDLRFHDPIGFGGGREPLEHIIFTQDLGNGGKAAFALRIARLGLKDLEISWRLFARNTRTEMNRTAGPFAGAFAALIIMGLLTMSSPGNLYDGSILVSMLMMIVGLIIALVLVLAGFRGVVGFGKGEPSITTPQRLNTLLFGKLVYQSVMGSLDELGVEPHELEVVQQAQLIGK